MKEKSILWIMGVIIAVSVATGLAGVVVRVYENEQMKKNFNTITIPEENVPVTATPALEKETNMQEEEETESELFEEMKSSKESGNSGQVDMEQGTGQQLSREQPQSAEVQRGDKPAQPQSTEVQWGDKPAQPQSTEVQRGDKPAQPQSTEVQRGDKPAPAEPDIFVEEDNSVSGNYELPFVPAD